MARAIYGCIMNDLEQIGSGIADCPTCVVFYTQIQTLFCETAQEDQQSTQGDVKSHIGFEAY